jgi:DNA invertase Pin-like site-specific DNA recombinase
MRAPDPEEQLMRCALYARAASRPECEVQLMELRAYVERRGWPAAVEYVDIGTARSELRRLMKDARRRQFEAVLVWRLDRWGGNLGDCVEKIAELEELKVGWCAVSQGLDLEVLAKVLPALRAYNAEGKRERIKASMRLAKRRDFTSGRPQRVFDRGMARTLRAQGKSIREIAVELGVGRGTVERVLTRVPKGS